MFNVGGGELLVILLIAVIVLGPDKLPEAARKVGRVTAELRRMSNGFQQEMRDAMRIDETPVRPNPGPTLPPVETVVTNDGSESTGGAAAPGAGPVAASGSADVPHQLAGGDLGPGDPAPRDGSQDAA